MILADELARYWPKSQTFDGAWVLARPLPASIPGRLRDAIRVLLGRAEAVYFDPCQPTLPRNIVKRLASGRRTLLSEFGEVTDDQP